MNGGNESDTEHRHSGFSGILYNSGVCDYTTLVYDYPDDKYVDKYSFGNNFRNFSRSKLGDAIREVYNNSNLGWYNNTLGLLYKAGIWFDRGSRSINGEFSGIFYSYYNVGRAYDGNGSRMVISN